MRKIIMIECVLMVCCVAMQNTGCVRTDEDSSEMAVLCVRGTIQETRDNLLAGVSLRHMDNRGSVIARLRGVSDRFTRIELANEYAETILAIDLTGTNYHSRENKVRCYFRYLEDVFQAMLESGCPAKDVMTFFFKGMSKYRAACFSVPLEVGAQDEGRISNNYRATCARNLYGEYAQTMSEIRRFWLRDLRRRLPEGVHDEFKRQIAPYFDFPSENEFFQAPIFQFNDRAVALGAFQGCEDETDSASVRTVESQIQKCRELLTKDELDCNHECFRGFRRSLLQSITNVTSMTVRTKLANRYIEMMKDIDLDLRTEDYGNYEMRVLRFEMLIGTIFNVVKKTEVDKRVLMEFFLASMEKYKKACFSIPMTAKGEHESTQDFIRRKATVNNLHAMYLGRMCVFERGEVLEHLKFFPMELHKEYKRRSATILDCPTREDLLKTPMFNGK